VKNQYFGDVNDYRKYGLLRLLSAHGHISTAVCWMLTPDDGRGDGSLVNYLHQPETWRCFDCELFDCLGDLLLGQDRRDVGAVETAGILPSCLFFSQILPDDADGRISYFDSFLGLAQGCDLVFFDPDNGLEVKSKPCGRKGSSKYLYWHEVVACFESGRSVLIYQHFPRVPRDQFVAAKAKELCQKTAAREVHSFRTQRVLFLLASQERHRELFAERGGEVAERWAGQIRAERHRLDDSGTP
jgi:hypothetical protein